MFHPRHCRLTISVLILYVVLLHPYTEQVGGLSIDHTRTRQRRGLLQNDLNRHSSSLVLAISTRAKPLQLSASDTPPPPPQRPSPRCEVYNNKNSCEESGCVWRRTQCLDPEPLASATTTTSATKPESTRVTLDKQDNCLLWYTVGLPERRNP